MPSAMAREKQPLPVTTSPATPAPKQRAAGEAASWQRARAVAAEFNRKHLEFQAEAAGLAADFDVEVNAVVFAPGGKQAVHHVFPAACCAAQQWLEAHEEREAMKEMLYLLHKDVEGITDPEEAKAHNARLLELQADLDSRLQDIRAAASNDAEVDRPEKIRRVD